MILLPDLMWFLHCIDFDEDWILRYLHGKNNMKKTTIEGKLNLVDLAGSERVSKSKVEGIYFSLKGSMSLRRTIGWNQNDQ